MVCFRHFRLRLASRRERKSISTGSLAVQDVTEGPAPISGMRCAIVPGGTQQSCRTGSGDSETSRVAGILGLSGGREYQRKRLNRDTHALSRFSLVHQSYEHNTGRPGAVSTVMRGQEIRYALHQNDHWTPCRLLNSHWPLLLAALDGVALPFLQPTKRRRCSERYWS